MTPSIVVSEIFGPTFQGEGPHLGQRVGFVRTGGCNLHCAWCDTPYTWDATRYDLRAELTRTPADKIVDAVLAMDVDRVVVTGGEPMLWQARDGWHQMLGDFHAAGIAVDVETNGTIAPDPWTLRLVDLFCVSPKLAHAGDPERLRIVPDVLRTFGDAAQSDRAALKVVVSTPADVTATTELAERYGFPKPAVWVMPEGTTSVDVLDGHRLIAQAALDHGVNMTTRLHVLTWEAERAR